jgi:flavodoxin
MKGLPEGIPYLNRILTNKELYPLTERYKLFFTFTNGEQETAYFTENPSHRVNDWLEREKNQWIRLDKAIINLHNVNMIRLAKVKVSDNSEDDDEIIEWI